METNFFTQIAKMNLTGDLQVTIKQATTDTYVVAVLLQNEQCGDTAKQLIPPLILKGTVKELDNGFFENICAPLQTASGLMVNMESFLKQVEETKKQSAMEKEKGEKQKKEVEAKEKKYSEAMQKVSELEQGGNYREAWMKVPNEVDYPLYADLIRKRRAELSKQFSPTLFTE